MRKSLAILVIIIGWILVIISIIALVKGFDAFSAMDVGTESIGYAIGSIAFPLLLTVSGRWIIRKGVALLRK